nr:MAG TPA: hypothetical protein [Bacteriophage sp.]
MFQGIRNIKKNDTLLRVCVNILYLCACEKVGICVSLIIKNDLFR